MPNALAKQSLSVDTIALKDAIAAVAPALAKDIVLPLSNLVFDFSKEGLWVSGFDGDLAIAKLVADVEWNEPDVRLFLPGKTVAIAARLNSDERTEFVFNDERTEFAFKQSDRAYSVPLSDGDFYFEFPEVPPQQEIALSKGLIGELSSLLTLCPDEGSKKYAGLMPVNSYIRLVVKQGQAIAMAGFAHRAGLVEWEVDIPDVDVLLSKRFLQAIAKPGIDFEGAFGNGQIAATSRSMKVVGRVGSGAYPPFDQFKEVFRKNGIEWEFSVFTKEMNRVLGLVSVVVDDKRPGLSFIPSASGFSVEPRYRDLGFGHVDMSAETQDSQAQFSLNTGYLRDGLSFLGSEGVFFQAMKGGTFMMIKPVVQGEAEKTFFIAAYADSQNPPQEEVADD